MAGDEKMVEGWVLPEVRGTGDAPFWEAATRGELVIQECASCGSLRHPPRPMCPRCRSLDHRWKPMSGLGRVWSFVVAHPPLLPAFAAHVPYNVVVVELDEDPTIRLVGNLVPADDVSAIDAIDPAGIEIGARVQAVFAPMADDVTLVRWARLRG